MWVNEASIDGHISDKKNVTDHKKKVFDGQKEKYLVGNIFLDIYHCQ